MTKIILHGCNGRMGQAISRLVEKDSEIDIVAGVDIYNNVNNPYPVYTDIKKYKGEADVIIDFASATAIDNLIDYSRNTGIPVVVCTTGLSKEQVARLEELSKSVAVLYSANMSVGINVLFKVLSSITGMLANSGYDIEIIEKHHNQKLDAPSGTALALADVMNKQLNNEFDYVYDRSKVREKRTNKEIGISAIRGGTIVGEHSILFAGEDEVIEIKHTAYSRNIFAKGAIEAAKYLNGKGAGLYSMKEVVE